MYHNTNVHDLISFEEINIVNKPLPIDNTSEPMENHKI